MYVTPEQQLIMSVLGKAGCLKLSQILPILRTSFPRTSAEYAERMVFQLQYINKLRRMPDDVVTTYLHGRKDDDMLSAVDVMLDICKGVPSAWAARRDPFQLTFLNGEKLHLFAVLCVAQGAEGGAGAMVEAETAGIGRHTRVIFILSALEQKKAISTILPHFFAYREDGRYRYFKGGDAQRD